MKLVKKYYIELDVFDKETVLAQALGIDKSVSRDDFIDYIETLINGASIMIENELTEK